MAKLFNLARMTTATTGTGTITLGSAVAGYLTFAQAGVSNGDVVSYAIHDGNNSEIGTGTYTSSGTTLTRTVTNSTNSNAVVSLSGTAEVFISPRAADLAFVGPPQGRLTLVSGVAVMRSSVSSATTVYYTPCVGGYVPIYNGSGFTMTAFSEMSQLVTDTMKSPTATAATSAYDMFVWNDGGTLRCTRGPAWTNPSTRSAGTALVIANGIYLNNAAIANGPAAQRGTYVGSIRTDGNGNVNVLFGGAAVGGIASSIGIWNAANRVPCFTMTHDETVSWTYASGTYRVANGSLGNTLFCFRGLDVDGMKVSCGSLAAPSTAGVAGYTAVGMNSTTATSGKIGYTGTGTTLLIGAYGEYAGIPPLGDVTFYALENTGGVSVTFFGNTSHFQSLSGEFYW